MDLLLSYHLAELCKDHPEATEQIIQLAYAEGQADAGKSYNTGLAKNCDLVLSLQVRNAILRRGLARCFRATLEPSKKPLARLDDVQMAATEELVLAGYRAPADGTLVDRVCARVDGVTR